MSVTAQARLAVPIAWLLLAVSGCALSPAGLSGALVGNEQAERTDEAPAESNSAQEAVGATPSTQATASQPPSHLPADAKNKSAQAAELVAALHALRALSAAEQDQLVKDLEQTDPQLWPLVTQQFRASLDYRQRQVQSSTAATTSPPTAAPTVKPMVLAAAVEPKAQAAAPQAAATPANHEAPAAKRETSTTHVALATGEQLEALAPTDWQQPLGATIASLEESLRQSPGSDDRQVYLRMLYLIQGDRDKLLAPLAGREPAEQEFWSKEMYGLSVLMDTSRQPDRRKRATEAAIQLGEAHLKLGQTGLLVVRNLSFCTEVSSYGVYKRFDKAEFKPEQRVVLYAEVENFVSQSTPQGHHTALGASYQIFDHRGAKVEEQELPTMEEYCQNPRRDFFVAYSDLRLPKQIYDGRYMLKLTIEDSLGKKIGQSSLEFSVKNSAASLATYSSSAY